MANKSIFSLNLQTGWIGDSLSLSKMLSDNSILLSSFCFTTVKLMVLMGRSSTRTNYQLFIPSAHEKMSDTDH